MPDLLISDLDEATLRTITDQAAVTNRSVDAVARDLIRIGLLHDAAGRVAIADDIRRRGAPVPVEDSTEVIRRLRGQP